MKIGISKNKITTFQILIVPALLALITQVIEDDKSYITIISIGAVYVFAILMLLL